MYMNTGMHQDIHVFARVQTAHSRSRKKASETDREKGIMKSS